MCVWHYLLSHEDDGQLLGELFQTVLQGLPQADNNPVRETETLTDNSLLIKCSINKNTEREQGASCFHSYSPLWYAICKTILTKHMVIVTLLKFLFLLMMTSDHILICYCGLHCVVKFERAFP